jgi:S-adenosylmethionine decarboxylase
MNIPVTRQRFIIEGFECGREVHTLDHIYDFLIELSEKLNMSILVHPVIVKVPAKDIPNQFGYSAHVIWLESGAQLHTWPEYGFITVDIFSCKEFSTLTALDVFNDYFKPSYIQIDIPQTIKEK